MPKCRFHHACLAILVTAPILVGAMPACAQRASDLARAPNAQTASIPAPPPAPEPQPMMQMAAIGDIVSDIRIEGAQRIEPETVTSYLTFGKGDQATQDKIDASLKALYATGLFKDVSLAMDGSTLAVKVVENPIINRITFEGNDAVSKDDLEKEIQLKPRLVYTLPRVQRDVQRILDLYRRQGRFAAVVEPKIVQLAQNRVDLVFEITEGKRTGIRSINFVGNEHFDSDELREAISTRETAWYRFFTNTDYYDPDRMNYDKDLLRRFYLNEGYVDFRVLSAVAELTPDREDFFITFTVEEGPRYKFGNINIKSEIKGLDPETLRPYITTKKGEWYSADQIDKSITALTTVLGDKQYAFANIVPTPDRHKDTHRVDLTYEIKPGERVYVGRINISGNTRTVDKVIRREMQLAEGDPFNSTAVHLSEQKLKDLNFFKTVEVKPVDGTQPDRADINVKVEEKSTGEISVGAGFSSTDGPLGDFNIHESNFMGQGQDARIGATISGRERQLDTSFTEPYFLDRNLSAGVDAFHTQTDNQDLSSYVQTSSGFALRLGYPLSQELRQKLNYTFHADNINDVAAGASEIIVDQQGATTTSSFGQELDYDTRDSKLNPTLGFITHLDTDVAGAGGSRKWARVRLGGTQYYPLADKWIVSAMGEVGEIWGLDGPTLIDERFYIGGDTLRGFQYAGIGPRDLTDPNQDALGGNRFTRGTLELSTPTPFPPEFGLTGHFFSDAGTLSRADLGSQVPAGDVIVNDGGLHLSAGIGVTWQSPFGPVRLDFAEPIIYKNFDKIQHINFNFGTTF
jgi:outer membrane protein insertion porin family